MKKITVLIVAWTSGLIGQVAFAKEASERFSSAGQSSSDVGKYKSALDALDEAGVLHHADNEGPIDTTGIGGN